MQKNINPVNTDNYWLRGIYIFGGDEEDRTLDLTDANRTLSQLSYAPKYIFYFITPFQICTYTTYCENNEFVYKNKCNLHE